ncbi:discoidin domain-containing protein [Haliangium sp. UPWRP_2]|uniref:discoidin domain-containing protein n=1 Tax=Haliangium sp. UPWRP_2 TaxID=1931276 RepID=UPI000B53A2F1|nr:discoidin domain-containing protein [Haliangium sp. UPWRP_2]PSM31350.1 carbohydrate-binding protein [Haliangium sp. UPWRP_2]
MRKRILKDSPPAPLLRSGELDVATIATALVTSEASSHPVENMFDGRPDTRWIAQDSGEQTLILAFDAAQPLHRVALTIEEREASRTQELDLAVSSDGGLTWRELVRQEFNFSPGGATMEREEWRLPPGLLATHLRLRIRPDKSGAGRATVTSLALS